MLITSTKNANIDRVKMLIVGPSGAGKTTLASTIKEKTLFVGAESGDLVLKDHDIDKIDLTKDDKGELLPAHLRYRQINEVYRYLLSKDSIEKYKWIFVDSLTEIAQILVDALKVDPDYSSKSKALNMWGEYNDTMIDFIKKFRDIPYYNVAITCLAEKENINGNITMEPMVFGKISSKISQYFDHVYYVVPAKGDDVVKKPKLLTTRTEEFIYAKHRGCVLQKFEEPNLDLISKKIKGGK